MRFNFFPISFHYFFNLISICLLIQGDEQQQRRGVVRDGAARRILEGNVSSYPSLCSLFMFHCSLFMFPFLVHVDRDMTALVSRTAW